MTGSSPRLPLRDRPGLAILATLVFGIAWALTARSARRQTRSAIARGRLPTPDGPA